MKIVVYAISKNESKFVDRWYESMKEADEIYVLDTGSTDDTVEKLKNHNIFVKEEIINPWRFDVARNKSLDMVPLDTDICVCTDLDEIFNPGWRTLLESSWNNTNRLRYTYNWKLDEENNPVISFMSEKIHDRLHYKWIYPVHEILKCNVENEIVINNENIIVNHYPDSTKSRSNYLPLLELSIKEDPVNERNLHYLGREYMFHRMWNESIDTLIKHIKVSTWDLEKCASMRFISRCYYNMGRFDEAELWLKKAISVNTTTRDAFTELAIFYFNTNKLLDSLYYFIKSLTLPNNTKVYINEEFTKNEIIYDYMSIIYYNLGLIDEALFYVNKVLDINPNNERVKNNKELFLK